MAVDQERIMLSKKGIGIMEIIVSTVLLALILAGMVNIFISGKRHIISSRSRMSGGELGKHFMDPLQMHVRQDTWDKWDATTKNDLTTGTRYCDDGLGHTPQQSNCSSATERTINGVKYGATYVIDSVAGTDLRRVKTTIAWPKTSP